MSSSPAKTLAAARGVLVTFGGSALLAGTVIGAAAEAGRALARGRRPRLSSALVLAGAGVYEAQLAPAMRSWGASEAERRRSFPGDEAIPNPGTEITQAVTISAPLEGVWPWLAQIGQDRGRPTFLYRALLEIPHFVMQRKMLLGIKQRAEAAARA